MSSRFVLSSVTSAAGVRFVNVSSTIQSRTCFSRASFLFSVSGNCCAPSLVAGARFTSSSSSSEKKQNGSKKKRNEKASSSSAAGAEVKATGTKGRKKDTAVAAAAPEKKSSSAPAGEERAALSKQDGSGKSDDATSSGSKKSDEVSDELEVEAVRWEVPEVSDRTVDEKGQYIVSKTPWTKRGELAYTIPDAPAPHEARFGYQIVVVKKPQSYWQWYRTQFHMFSISHLLYQVVFCLCAAWLMTWVQLETEFVYAEMRRPGNMAGDVYGKGDPNRHQKKITVSPEERDEVMQAMQMAFMDGKDMASRASRDKRYTMKKIPRPKELTAEDFSRGG